MTYDKSFNLQSDILANVEVKEGRVFTLRLRKGHRWSDGTPFTTEDFRYWWEDVANHKKLSPLGPPKQMVVAGEPANFKVIDTHTIQFSWSTPNPHFLPALAASTPLYIYRPAHYMKKFHVMRAVKLKRWLKNQAVRIGQHCITSSTINIKDNPDLPTLQPWVLRTKPPSQRFIFERNPYFHRVDQNGRQLPYIDEI